jgi:hypothetical protein
MSSPLVDVWEAAAASPFQPSVGKDSQFTLGFALLFACTSPVALCHAPDANVMLMLTRPPALLLTGYFGLSMSNHRSLTLTLTPPPPRLPALLTPTQTARSPTCPSSALPLQSRSGTSPRPPHHNPPLTLHSFGAVYMICAVGVYV